MMFDYALRGSLQQSIDKSKDLVSRNKMGQYATPKSLASEICQYVDSISKWNYPIEVLEPALGLGIFIEVLKFETDLDINRYTGIELDEDFFNAAEKLWKGFNVDLVKSDFMLFNTNKKFQIIISNPPYVRHHHLIKDYKTKIQNLTSPAFGDKMSKLAGLYCFFIGRAHDFLAKDGISVWLIPSEFLDVNYGKVLKEYLLKKVEVIHIHKYKKEDNLFENAIVSSCVVIFKQKQDNSSTIRFSYGGRISNPKFNNFIDSKLIKSDSKWSNYFGNRQSKNIEIKTRIEDYFNVKRGLVTGNNKFFILGKKEIEHHGIEKECLTPILPSSRYLDNNTIKSDISGIPILENERFVIQITLPLSEIKRRFPNLFLYLTSELSKDVRQGYICRNRKPWYNIGKHNSPLFLCTYMGRVKDGKSPFRFIANDSIALIANSMLGLYPKINVIKGLEEGKITMMELLNQLEKIDSETMISGSRVYGGGMHKIEPRELSQIPFSISNINKVEKELLLFSS